MYEPFYGLTDKPFSLTPNPRFVFYSQQYREAEGQLLYGINNREGFMVVTGQPGTGKTTLCRDLIEKLDREKSQSALIFNPFLNGVEMLAALLSEFGVNASAAGTRKELLDRLNQFLLAQLALGKSCVAIFDEAQHLSPEFLEQIRVLSNLETDQEKLIQIVLVGQPELLERIRTSQMSQLDQRVSIRCTLNDLDEQETDRYIHHRLNVAGARGQIRFNPRAINAIYRASHGVPRLINLICDRALLAGYAAQTRDIGLEEVNRAIIALRGEEPGVATPTARTIGRRSWRNAALAAGAVALVAGITAAVAFWPGRSQKPDAETLYWRGTMSNSPAQQEADLRALVAQYPRSQRVDDALTRLAQLAMARGDQPSALQALGEIRRREPAGPSRTAALTWVARIDLESGDTASACRALATDETETRSTGATDSAIVAPLASPLGWDATALRSLCASRSATLAAVGSAPRRPAIAPASTSRGAAPPSAVKPDSPATRPPPDSI
jgi:type II secretory pathway predicted ATPase ExeA